MSKKYLNLHVLYTFAGANPNRDDVGSPKSLVYGGRERSRMSSQAMTRAKRSGYESDPEGERAFRSNAHARYLTEQVVSVLEEDGVSVTEEVVGEIRNNIDAAISSLTTKKKGKAAATSKESKDNDAKDTVTILSDEESQKIVNAAIERVIAGTPSKEIEVSDFIDGPKTTSLSIAAFGRMFAVRNDLACEAAVQRSNAFTTHEASTEIDYFTVLDDLKNADEAADSGAAHLGLKQLTGGVYYWHANIDKGQLRENLSEGFDFSDGRAVTFFRHLLNDLPQGMDKTTATAQLVPFVLAVESDSPVSLQSAFEKPVETDSNGYLNPSIERIIDAHRKNVAFDPETFGEAFVSGVEADLAGDALPVVNLSELSDFFATWVRS
jgi:CRISPR system Cascade subunit CasC